MENEFVIALRCKHLQTCFQAHLGNLLLGFVLILIKTVAVDYVSYNMTKSFVVLVMSFMTFCSPEIYMGISRLGKDLLPMKMRAFWDSPRMWLAASQRPLVSCSKRQSLLNSLSANQLFHLDPYMDGWCQKISLSDKIYNELTTSAHELPIDWSSIMTTITAKLTGYFNKSEEPKETKLIVVNTTFNSTTGNYK
ncbi:unnamed protein product [Trichobilharzia regenti]|nr:unnamed protein product [Trichobilharzia regenti]